MESYQELSDEQLIRKLREGDSKIMDFILDKYKPLVRKKSNAMYLIGGDTDDLIQEGMIGLFKAIRDYDESKEASFYHFAELCINRQIYSAIEASNRKKHAPLNSYISFYSESNEDGVAVEDLLGADFLSNPEEVVIAQESQEILLQKLRAKLSKFEQNVLDDYLSGMNYQQIAEKMGKSPKAIDNALQRIKGKMK
ncbi:MAG: sigma-70 family RNA polymerase sigma factor [Roseburia sp.]|uniref:sigma-70 family RNA polymerase sigma factor n=1 Tax=Roseburia sp. 831b TaxID=1261635 RepID=UPI00095113B6|nr:sigma-70 family RNA polymerase sigma factor [Roseburia sp. 831b]MDD6217571.1 sigma-70 family RNA polymerase sigma factor [Roseburia sp.]WVK73485.1 sigma-70 family RNA polymerase sigma factor [Roseburia sp. 831b]